MQGLKPEEVAEVARCLTWRNDHRGQAPMFEDGGIRYSSEAVREHTERYWSELQKTGALDRLDEARRKADAECRGLLRTRTVKHTDARNAGAEWLCLQAINQLRIRELLLSKGWRGEKADTAIAHLVARTVYGASELHTRRHLRQVTLPSLPIPENKNLYYPNLNQHNRNLLFIAKLCQVSDKVGLGTPIIKIVQ